MEQIIFRWVGLNRKFNEITINKGLTTQNILDGRYLSFFNYSNRGELGNCKFLAEELFTGLKDKNGVSIYDGDIITYYSNNFGEQKTLTVEVKTPLIYYITKIGSIEIIGNIHENPELLK